MKNAWRGQMARVLAAATICACNSATENRTPSLSIALSADQVTLAQGASHVLTVTITQANLTSPVSLSVDGLPNGVAATFGTVVNSASAMTLTATSTATPGAATLTIRVASTGVSDQMTTVVLTVTVTGSYGLSVAPTSLSVNQGTSSSALVTIARSGGFAGDVNLSVTGAPAGLSASFPMTSATSATLMLSAAANTPPGSYSLTIEGVSAGLMSQTTTLTVQIVQITSITLRFCAGGMPTWLGYQNEGGSWARVTQSGDAFVLAVTPKVSVAYVVARPATGYDVSLILASVSDLSAISGMACIEAEASKTVTGTASGLSGKQTATIAMGARIDTAMVAVPSYALDALRDGPLDLVAVRATVDTPPGAFPKSTPSRLIVRRSLNPANGASIPALDFAGSEAVIPATNTLTVGGPLGGVAAGQIDGSIVTAGGTASPIYWNQVPGSQTSTLYSVPSQLLVDGDLHIVHAYVLGTSSEVGVRTSYRVASDRSIDTGGYLSSSTCSHNAEMPYPLYRCYMNSQADYDAVAQWILDQTAASRSLTMTLTAGHFGGRPATWDVTFPSIPPSLGFDPSWMPVRGQPLTIWASGFSGRAAIQLGAGLVDGDVIRYARSQGFWTP